jgi:REP element-mobilizing transposase RayT
MPTMLRDTGIIVSSQQQIQASNDYSYIGGIKQMPSPRKYYPHDAALFITSRTEEGLPFVASYLLNFIIEGILARATSMYDITLCHYLFMANHFHMLAVVKNPERVDDFIGYVKAETAHAINRLLGRRQKTVWQAGYDSVIQLTAEDTMNKIQYLYNNAAKANLVESINDYPGLSSWKAFKSGSHSKECKRVSRNSITPLPAPAVSIAEQLRLKESYKRRSGKKYILKLEPNAWMDCFPETRGIKAEVLNAELFERIETQDTAYSAIRKKDGRRVIGATALRRASMLVEYTPKTYGSKKVFSCADPDLRASFREHYKHLCALAREAYLAWKQGDFSFKIPPGMLAPRVPALVSALPIQI